MKMVALLARLLLGLVFVFFGLNGLLHFLPTPPMPPGHAADFANSMTATHYISVVAALEVIGGLLVIITRFVPLGLTILGPLIVNILLFHLLMSPQGLPIALVVTVLWLVAAWRVRAAFAGIFTPGL